MVNSRLRETERPRGVKTPRSKITRKREFESYHKRFQDFEIGPNFSETQVFEERFYSFYTLIIHDGFPGRGD